MRVVWWLPSSMVNLPSVCSLLVLSLVPSSAGSPSLVYCTGACVSSVVSLRVFLCWLGGISNVLGGGEVRSLGEVGVLVNPPF